MLETSSGNALDETEENDFDQRKVGEEEKKFMSNSYSLLQQARKRNQRTSSRACLLSSHQLEKLKVVLVWSCLLS